jgi:hypothetical protein
LNPKLSDDPHDFVVVPPDAVRVAPSDEEELSGLLHQAARHRADALGHAASDLATGPTIPPVDTTFRPTAANDAGVPGNRRTIGSRVLRPLIALLLAACVGLGAVAWKSYGEKFTRLVTKWTTQAVMTASLSPEEPAAETQPVVLAAAAAEAPSAASPQSEAPVQSAAGAAAPATAPAAVDPSTGSAQQLQSMARELADLGQEVAQLKASLAQLKSSQQQASRDAAKTSEAKASEAKAAAAKPSEQHPRPRISVTSPPSPRSVEARPRQPAPSPPAQAAAPPPAPYYASRQPDYAPRQPDYYAQRQPDYAPRQIAPQPQFAAEPQGDPEMSSIPRPPMPVR